MSLSVSLLLLGISLVIPCVHTHEVQALLEFKSFLFDPEDMLYNWTPDSPNPCNWTGISCCDPFSFRKCSASVQAIRLNAFFRGGGYISPFIGNLSYLRELDLSNNFLSGSIPASFGMLSKLVTINLSRNSLSGVIPPEIGKISSMQTLDLSFNDLEGSIPASFGMLSRLVRLDLSHNFLSGVIQSEIGKISSMQTLNLANNNFSGAIPSEVGSLYSLCYLDLSGNSLIGTIPSKLPKLLLQSHNCLFDISANSFNGTLPSWLFSTKSICKLDLSYNDFEGSVPCIENMVNTRLFLDGNPRIHSHCTSPNRRLFILLGGLAALCPSVVLGLLVFLKWKSIQTRKSIQNRKSLFWAGPKFIRVSQQELIIATNNFSQHNLVGTGGSSRVYCGILPSSECVAVKVFYGLDLEEEEEQRTAAETRFLRECHTLGQIRHRNLVKIITACCGENIRALIMQFMPNGNLHELLHLTSRYGRLMPLSLRTRLLLIKDIASALSYLHNDCCPALIHCDVKPHNVLLNEDMTACLSDFGMARITETSNMAASLRLEGSVGYIAPEYGTGVEPWSRGDVYSFGVVVLEVLTRTRPTDEEILGEQRLSEWVSMVMMKGTEHWYPLICGRDGQCEISALSNAHISLLEQLLKVGVCCCCQEPHVRPTMREVDELLSKLYMEVIGEETKPISLKSSLSGYLTSMERKVQASKPPPASDSSTF